ncbi:hypothetical protein H6G89_26140 [Oscillatoria sp. FACHB-1407]|uniref:hypothetical protein n=1 Tax=Oscillatoria sp. FACHB-1407 TaxID=2692847 RepID=UPI001688067B|nr:hypothetical protein [Oscillatoria sp. FACHB-1407]MBD2464491.1 hypothetical protein [Oscillatoria sp. FACHB-1407]
MNSRLLERSPPTWTPEDAGFDEPTQVGFAPIAAVSTVIILLPSSGSVAGIRSIFYLDVEILDIYL